MNLKFKFIISLIITVLLFQDWITNYKNGVNNRITKIFKTLTEAKRLGHSSILTTQNYYLELMPEKNTSKMLMH